MNSAYDNFIISAITELPKTQEDFLQLKKKLSKRYKLPIPTNADLRDRYNDLVLENVIKPNPTFEEILLSRRIRTQSGVAVVAVLTKSYPCPGKCIYCPSEKEMPKSYLSKEPAVMRAIDSHFDPYLQVQNRLHSLELNGHKTDKIELIVMGGTFSYLPKSYQKRFITRCFQACNEYGSYKVSKVHKVIKSINSLNEKLLNEQNKNEFATHRIVGLTLETRPDYIDKKEILNFRKLGCTRVELGVQSLYDDVLKLNKRGHLVDATINATRMLKDAGFKINYHMMPGLPGSTPKKDFEMFKELFEKQEFQPDMLKIYPTVVLKDSLLYKIWKRGDYKPLTNKIFEKLVLKIKNGAIPPYVRIARLIRDVPTSSIISGPTVSNLRQLIIPQSNCPCIRCREVREGYKIKEKIILDRIDYPASDGLEIFLQYVSPDKKKLFALLRLRIPSHLCHSGLDPESRQSHQLPNNLDSRFHGNDKLHKLLPVLENAALIREVHTYGKMAQIDEKDASSPQHIGLGKKLLLEAERIAKEEYGLKKIAVISGVGVRGYYRKSGYRLKDTYMIKGL
ncbi:MAG: tRNA uridine(34) 5-carboxymethylaminomethyl modification radical SAM/GNAT enzyme Elp3 [Candidatus Moranbacteria bacterium]|nr:tRNA uridine(34) 5-carboxymethylaminomethyl modification radical SAM/GNAT enzyme Elp3 [Candidatus Moranbacteria bacterium]